MNTPVHPTAAHGYHPLSKLQHWVMALIWIAAWIIGFIAVHFRDALNAHHELTILHKALASTVIFLTVFRIVWRWRHPAPALPASMSPALRRAAHQAHIALYALALVALPLSGWMWSSVADKPIMMLGLVKLPPLVAPAPEYYGLAKMVHQWLSWSIGLLVLGHAAAALKHHFHDRDGVLTSMLPARKAAGGREQS
ncbi:cytochrome b [Telluria aromaticivorans]|uniref:Cytochrome b n=1 Tax=Telluria aromaticivorans TaxID=2725995 RepID=A0A7Y2JW29_9BURK|nr:cytochrome b [Telluria aromaticivorans]NNG21981.1 cytochrome b [Telluria aromaticivorans]